jgi:membrane protein DedA with SNARE-associated domain
MPTLFDHTFLHHAIAHYGYWAVPLLIMLECVGLPVPGETVLVSAAIYAGTTHQMNIEGVVVVAGLGAILGGVAGYLIGRELGYPLLLRYGPRVGLTEGRFKLGRYLFVRHGGKVVFFGRFVALLRVLAALLAGATRMTWLRFLLFNALGGIAWAALFGFGGYALGGAIRRIAGPAGWTALGLVTVGLLVGWFFLRRHEARLVAEAERAFPEPEAAPQRPAA